MNLSEKDAAGVRARLDTADRTVSGITEQVQGARAHPWQWIRNRRRLADSEQALDQARLLLAACQGIMDGSRRSCCPTATWSSHLGTCTESAMNTGRWNP